MRIELPAHFVPNWTSAAGAVEGVLAALGTPLPRHAVMGLSGHAWHFHLGEQEGTVAHPSGPLDLDWERMTANYGRLGWRWERFGTRKERGEPWDDAREAAIAWARPHLDAGRPLVGFDFHLREFGVVTGYDDARTCWLVDDLLSADYGAEIAWVDWPGDTGWLELIAPLEPLDLDPVEAVEGSLRTAREFIGGEGATGAAGIERWAEALDGENEVDRAGNAYTLAVLLAARSDGAQFLADLIDGLPDLSRPLREARSAIDDEVAALAPLASLFPFPAGGHGNLLVPGLRRAAAMALRRAATAERRALAAFHEALALFD